MGWRGQDNREREWRKLPLRERYDWPSLLFVIFLAAFTYALWSGG
jgi:hypothetical protein